MLVADTGEARDPRREGPFRVDERREPLADGDAAIALEADARRSDLDDAVGAGIEPGGLEVERYEVDVRRLLGPHGGEDVTTIVAKRRGAIASRRSAAEAADHPVREVERGPCHGPRVYHR